MLKRPNAAVTVAVILIMLVVVSAGCGEKQGYTVETTYDQTSDALTVSTLAGEAGQFAVVDGTGPAARFGNPSNIASDPAGNLFVVDDTTIRKVTPAGKVTTWVGTEGQFDDSGDLTATSPLQAPFAIACAPSGIVYVSDGNAIRKITRAGKITTFAGEVSTAGSTDGQGTAARFSHPLGMTCDAAGNLYVADWMNDTIRKVTPAGSVTTLAGKAGVEGEIDSTGAEARFSSPCGIVCDPAGNLYVVDESGYTVRRVTPAGEVTTIAGKSDSRASIDGPADEARFLYPRAIARDSAGNLYVTDQESIRKIAPDGTVTTLAGTPRTEGRNEGTGSQARFKNLIAAVVAPSGILYVVDNNGPKVRTIEWGP